MLMSYKVRISYNDPHLRKGPSRFHMWRAYANLFERFNLVAARSPPRLIR